MVVKRETKREKPTSTGGGVRRIKREVDNLSIIFCLILLKFKRFSKTQCLRILQKVLL